MHPFCPFCVFTTYSSAYAMARYGIPGNMIKWTDGAKIRACCFFYQRKKPSGRHPHVRAPNVCPKYDVSTQFRLFSGHQTEGAGDICM